MEYSKNSSPTQAGMLSSSDDDSCVVVDGTTSRRSKRVQIVAEDMAEILLGDILAVKPGSKFSFVFQFIFCQFTWPRDPFGYAGFSRMLLSLKPKAFVCVG